ncbi:MAG: 3-oxoacyl-ACP reductase [Actinomycetota bacterium]|nr:3-oxoacyl-ACP reductase [Actinomycetota bacterium]
MPEDLYSQVINSRIGGFVAGNVGLPQPVELDRYEPGGRVIDGEVLLGAAPGGRLSGPIARVLAGAGAVVKTELEGEVRAAAGEAGLDAGVWNPDGGAEARFKALVLDASGISDSTDLRELWKFFHPTIRLVERSGRIIVLGTPPEACGSPRQATAQRALEGFTRAVGKEVRKGASSQLVYVDHGAEDAIDSTLRFLLSPRSAYVSGQVVRIAEPVAEIPAFDPERPLQGKVALVTGASRGIGAAIADVLSRDGAHVVGLDVPALEGDLKEVVGQIGGSALAADITEDEAPARIADHLASEHEGVDIVVHNAGVTRDKTLGRMDAERWDLLTDINLSAQERIDDGLLERDLIRPNGRLIGVSSISGIAGNAGQTNYSTSKAGVIGRVESMAPLVGNAGVTINAVAPGFIETAMTKAMPVPTREAGRRMNSMLQGGLPLDVAEAIAWFAGPGSAGVNGNVVRVCGQSLIGA